jgi:hypothetical protein
MARIWPQLSGVPEIELVRFSHLRGAVANLEVTYIIRAFSEFEGLLYDHLAARHPGVRIPRTTEALVNRVALRERIPDPIREAAQRVREYRNSIVHRRAARVPPLSFAKCWRRSTGLSSDYPTPPSMVVEETTT